jgi:hypothetical protein
MERGDELGEMLIEGRDLWIEDHGNEAENEQE